MFIPSPAGLSVGTKENIEGWVGEGFPMTIENFCFVLYPKSSLVLKVVFFLPKGKTVM